MMCCMVRCMVCCVLHVACGGMLAARVQFFGGHPPDTCIDMYIDLCMDMRIDLCTDLHVLRLCSIAPIAPCIQHMSDSPDLSTSVTEVATVANLVPCIMCHNDSHRSIAPLAPDDMPRFEKASCRPD